MIHSIPQARSHLINGTLHTMRFFVPVVCFFALLRLSMRLAEGPAHMPGGHFSLSGQLSIRNHATVEASGYWAGRDAAARGSLSGSGTTGRLLGCMGTLPRDL
jgi:hypothetical protein